MTNAGDLIQRREFIKILGPGLYVLFSLDGFVYGQQAKRSGGYPDDFNAYLRISEDGSVTCFSGKVELGQGVITSLAQLLAEELEVKFQSVTMVLGDTLLCPWDSGTNGSRSIKIFGPVLRAAGAEAKEVLKQLAADYLQVPEERLTAKDGIIHDSADPAKNVSYGTLTKGKTIERHLQKKPPLKSAKNFIVCGKSLPRPDFLEKVTGKAKFAGDMRIEGMLYGKVLHPPAYGAKLKNVDLSAAKGMEDVQIYQDNDFIGAVHPLPDIAEKAVALIRAEYEIVDASVNDETIYEHIQKNVASDNVVEQKGDLVLGEKESVLKFEEVYFTPYVAHAPMETHSALAQVKEDSASIWVGTQRPFGANQEIGRAIGINPDKVRIITPYVGGGFGGKSQVGQAIQAARLSKMSGHPVQVVWSREEEFFYDTFQPAAVIHIKSGTDASNRIAFWDYHVLLAGERSSQNIYDVPNLKTVSRGSSFGQGGPHPFGTGAWRGPGSNSNVFARESHIDSMAAKCEMDPLEFRLLNLNDARMVRVVKAAAEKFGWKKDKYPGGQGRGMVCLDYLGTYVCAMAQITVNRDTGHIQVQRIVHAQDMGPVINPEGARMQIEGAITMGLGYSLSEEIRFDGATIKNKDFGSYQIPRFSWTPKIESVLIENMDIDPSGCGEPPIVGMGALMANALFDATGIRIQQLPLTPARILERLKK